MKSSPNTLLFKALHKKDVSKARVKMLLQKGADVFAKNEENSTVLHLAANYGASKEVVELLLAHGAQVDAKDASGMTPLILASCGCDIDVVALLLAYGADVNVQDNDGWTALHAASNLNQDELLKLLLCKRANIHVKTKDGRTALSMASLCGKELLMAYGAIDDEYICYQAKLEEIEAPVFYEIKDTSKQNGIGIISLFQAVREGNKDSIAQLLAEGAEINMKDEDGKTALFYASRGTDKEIVELLLAHGADIHAKNKNGWTALHAVSEACYEKKIVELLLAHGADVNALTHDGSAALFYATSGGDKEVVELLLAHGADVHVKNKDGWTALHAVSETCYEKKIVELLLAHGADVNAVTHDGNTALHHASSPWNFGAIWDNPLDNAWPAMHKQIVELLLANGADVHIRNKSGQTALHRAAYDGYEEVIKLLLEYSADINARDNDGWTVLINGVRSWCIEIVELLLIKGADVHVRTKDSVTPRLFAEKNGYPAIAHLIEQYENKTYSAMKRYFIYKDEKSDKFWSIEVIAHVFHVVFGKMGTLGVTKIKEFETAAQAQYEAEKLIKEKLKKGYQEVIGQHAGNFGDIEFWSLIERAKNKTDDLDAFVEELSEQLINRRLEDIVEFEKIFQKYYWKAYQSKLWAAAYIINSGCSDDGFDYFRAWLIAQGKDIYVNTILDPEYLTKIIKAEDAIDIGCEDMLSVSGNAFNAKTGEDAEVIYDYIDPALCQKPEIEIDWNEDGDDLQRMFPKLWKKFWND